MVLLLVLFSGLILLRGFQTGASMRETILALAIDTVMFWVFLLLFFADLTKQSRNVAFKSISIVLGTLAGTALVLYALGWHDNIDKALGYGTCETQELLRTGGLSGWLRSRGFARNPNELGALLIIPWLGALGALVMKNWRDKYAWLLLCGFSGLLLVSFSRSAWIAGAIALFAFFILDSGFRRQLQHQRKVVVSIILFAALTVLVIVQLYPTLGNELFLHKGQSSDSTAVHFVLKEQGLQRAVDNPWGTGPGSAGAVGAALKDGSSIETESAYLDVTAQYGWLGLGLYVTLLGMMITVVWRARSEFSNIVVAGLIGLGISGLFIPIWSNLPVTIFAGLLAGLVATRSKANR